MNLFWQGLVFDGGRRGLGVDIDWEGGRKPSGASGYVLPWSAYIIINQVIHIWLVYFNVVKSIVYYDVNLKVFKNKKMKR